MTTIIYEDKMNRVTKAILLALALPVLILTGCGGSKTKRDGVKMTARVTAVGERIEVEVIESEYTSGPYFIITDSDTEYLGKNGERIARSAIKVGDTVEITYSGQVMLSYPPQVVAYSIKKV